MSLARSLCLWWHWTTSLCYLSSVPHVAPHDACSRQQALAPCNLSQQAAGPPPPLSISSMARVLLQTQLILLKVGTLNELVCHPCGRRGHANFCIVSILIYVLKKTKKYIYAMRNEILYVKDFDMSGRIFEAIFSVPFIFKMNAFFGYEYNKI